MSKGYLTRLSPGPDIFLLQEFITKNRSHAETPTKQVVFWSAYLKDIAEKP